MVLAKNTEWSDNSHYSDTAVKSDVSSARLPMSLESENGSRLQSAPQRQLTCFLRTKSDGAIGSSSSSSSTSSSFSALVDATNTPLAVTFQALSGHFQGQNGTTAGWAMYDTKLKKRAHQQPMLSNSTQWPRHMVAATGVEHCHAEDADSVEFQQKVPKLRMNDDCNLPDKLPAENPACDQSSYSLHPPTSALWWNGRFAATADKSIANALPTQKMSVIGKPNLDMSDITYCTAMPLSTSNIVNVVQPCSAAEQNASAIRRRVILIKRR